jgi:hypothetical protein
MYVSTIGNVNSLLKMELYPTALPMLANHLDKYDSFVKYIFEAINYIFSEYINDNPGYDVKKSSILAYMKKRQFFSGNVMSEDFFINRLYNLIIEEADDTQTPHSDGVEDVQPTEDTPDETIANEDGIDDTKQNKNNGRDPKSTAVLIIKSTSWQTIIEQVINYLTSIKAIK